MSEVLFPDAVALVIDWLNAQLDATAYPATPNPRPTEFLVVQRIGGIRRTRVSDEPRILVEAWADSIENASDLAQDARQQMHLMRGEVLDSTAIYRIVEEAGPALLPDPESLQHRYTATYLVHLRGAATGS